MFSWKEYDEPKVMTNRVTVFSARIVPNLGTEGESVTKRLALPPEGWVVPVQPGNLRPVRLHSNSRLQGHFVLSMTGTQEVVRLWSGAEQLDAVLCATLDGYAQSIQRKQAIQRFADTEDNQMARQRYHGLQSEIDAIPAGKLIDITRPLDGNARKVIAEYNQRKAAAEKDKRIAPLLLDMQMSQDPVHLAGLDRRLRVGLGEDYAHSIQRAQFIQKISGSEIGWIRDQYNQAKAEIDAVPADKRTDLSKRFKLAEPKTDN